MSTPQTPETLPASAPKRRMPLVFAGLLGLAGLGGGIYALVSYGKESTDNAQVEGHILAVAARINAQVQRVAVDDNQAVKKGDVLVELDPAEWEAKAQSAKGDEDAAAAAVQSAEASLALAQTNAEASLEQAQGGLVQAESGRSSSHAALAHARADLAAAASRLKLAKSEWERTVTLSKDGVATAAELDSREAAYTQAKAQLAQAEAQLNNTEAGLRSSGGGLATAQGRLHAAKAGPQQVALAEAALAQAKAHLTQAEAARKLADLNLSYTHVLAPFDGVVSKRNVEPGQMVSPEKSLFAVISTHDLWVVANFKEDQIADLRPGQPVDLTVDAYGRRSFHGEVESLSEATGARFSLLPPDNSSGNFIKVTQRVPVRIKLTDAHSEQLRIGMSVDVTVNTRAPGRRSETPPATPAITVGQK